MGYATTAPDPLDQATTSRWSAEQTRSNPGDTKDWISTEGLKRGLPREYETSFPHEDEYQDAVPVSWIIMDASGKKHGGAYATAEGAWQTIEEFPNYFPAGSHPVAAIWVYKGKTPFSGTEIVPLEDLVKADYELPSEFTRPRRNPAKAFTKKGERMYQDVKASGSAESPSAVVFAAAKRGVPGLVKKGWAREHGYPEPNPYGSFARGGSQRGVKEYPKDTTWDDYFAEEDAKESEDREPRALAANPRSFTGWSLYEVEVTFPPRSIPESTVARIRAANRKDAIDHAFKTIRASDAGGGARRPVDVKVIGEEKVKKGLGKANPYEIHFDGESNPSSMGSEDFAQAIKERADTGVGYLTIKTSSRLGGERYDSVTIQFINAPLEAGQGGGGAVAANNRLLMFVEGFGRGFNEPPPTGKVKFSVGAAEVLYGPGRDIKRPRGKTASPEKMVDYVVNIINEVSQLPPKLPPGRKNPYEIHFDGEQKASREQTTEFLRDVIGMMAQDAKDLAMEMQLQENRKKMGGNPGKILREISQLSGAFGIEGLWPGDGELSTRPQFGEIPLAEYVNTGDTYSPTVLYDYNEGKFYLTTYGDWVEKYESGR